MRFPSLVPNLKATPVPGPCLGRCPSLWPWPKVSYNFANRVSKFYWHERKSIFAKALCDAHVIAGTPQLDVTSLREVLLAMDSETRELRATLAELEKRKADRKEVAFRHARDREQEAASAALRGSVIPPPSSFAGAAVANPSAPSKKTRIVV